MKVFYDTGLNATTPQPNTQPAEVDRVALARAAQLIAGRRSVRRYTEQDVDEDMVAGLLRCAICAPSAHNRQPWRFAVVREKSSKSLLARAMGAQLRRDRLADGDDPGVVERDIDRSFERITRAPVIVLVAMSMLDMDDYLDERRRAAESAMAMQSTAMAVQNLLLAASAAGLGTCWMCAPLFCPDSVRDALDLPADWHPQAIITLGIPQGSPKTRARRSLHEVIRYERRT